MPSIRATASHDGGADSFNLYRDTVAIDPQNPPAPIATGLLACDYTDATVVDGNTYYYAFAAVRGAELAFSQSVSLYADPLLARRVIALSFDSVFEDYGITQPAWTWSSALPTFENNYAVFDGSQYVDTLSDALNFGNKDFTLELEIYPTNLTSYRMLFGAKQYTPYVQYGFNERQLFFNDQYNDVSLNCSRVFVVNTLYNIKLSRNGDVLSFRVNNVVAGTINIAGKNVNLNVGGGRFFGVNWSGAVGYRGRVHKVNVYKGIYV